MPVVAQSTGSLSLPYCTEGNSGGLRPSPLGACGLCQQLSTIGGIRSYGDNGMSRWIAVGYAMAKEAHVAEKAGEFPPATLKTGTGGGRKNRVVAGGVLLCPKRGPGGDGLPRKRRHAAGARTERRRGSSARNGASKPW